MTNGDLYLILARYRGATMRVVERTDGSVALMCGAVVVMSADPVCVCGEPATVLTRDNVRSCGHPACLAHHYLQV